MRARVLMTALAALVLSIWSAAAGAADRAALRDFLEVTGFDVAITSMQQGAMAGPGIAGDAPDDFGLQYTRLAEQVFDPDLMLERALDMMAAILPDDLLEHGAGFYASDLGQRLVVAENQSHLVDDDLKFAEGEAILEALVEANPDRVDDYGAMNDAIGGIESSVRAVAEIQLRYLLAAISAGSVDLAYSEDELRALIEAQIPDIRQNVAVYSILGAAYTYQGFSDGEMRAYRAALEAPEMRQVYEILNAIQFQIMAERYEALAEALAGLAPQQDI